MRVAFYFYQSLQSKINLNQVVNVNIELKNLVILNGPLPLLKHIIGHVLQIALWHPTASSYSKRVLKYASLLIKKTILSIDSTCSLDLELHEIRTSSLHQDIYKLQICFKNDDHMFWIKIDKVLLLLIQISELCRIFISFDKESTQIPKLIKYIPQNAILLIKSFIIPFLTNASALDQVGQYFQSSLGLVGEFITKDFDQKVYDCITEWLIESACKRISIQKSKSGPRTISVRKFCLLILTRFYNDRAHVLAFNLDQERFGFIVG